MGKVRAGLGLTGLTAAGCAMIVAGGTLGAGVVVDHVHHLATTPVGGAEEVQVDEYPHEPSEPPTEPERASSEPPHPQPTQPEDDPGIIDHLECDDPEALAVKEQHNADLPQPAGWPSEWDGTGPIPDPECHPDYLEIGEWVHHDEFHASWEGIETSYIADGGQSQEQINESLWEQSLARAEWSEEQWNG